MSKRVGPRADPRLKKLKDERDMWKARALHIADSSAILVRDLEGGAIRPYIYERVCAAIAFVRSKVNP